MPSRITCRCIGDVVRDFFNGALRSRLSERKGGVVRTVGVAGGAAKTARACSAGAWLSLQPVVANSRHKDGHTEQRRRRRETRLASAFVRH